MAFAAALAKMGKNITQSFEQEFKQPDITTAEMQKQILLWFQLYFESEGKDRDDAQRIPYIVVDGIKKAVFGEYELGVDEGTDKGKKMAAVLAGLEKVRNKAYQQALIGGFCFIKPVPKRDGFVFTVINRMNMAVLGRDIEGNINDLGTAQRLTRGKHHYTLLERRRVDENGYLFIENKLFCSGTRGELGRPAALDSLPEFAALPPEAVLEKPMEGLGLIPLKTPMENCVDGSEDAVAVYAAAVRKILTQYKHERRTEDEYELTAPHALVSSDVLPPPPPLEEQNDAFLRRQAGVELPKYIVPVLEGDPESIGIEVYNPTPNQEPLEARANQNMRDIENILGLRRGLLSHVETDDKTAAAVLTTSGRYSLTVKDFQLMWADAVRETVRVCDLLGQMYLDWDGSAPPEAEIGWGNGVLYDEDADYARMKELVALGYLRAEYMLRWMDIKPMDETEAAALRACFMPQAEDVTADEE